MDMFPLTVSGLGLPLLSAYVSRSWSHSRLRAHGPDAPGTLGISPWDLSPTCLFKAYPVRTSHGWASYMAHVFLPPLLIEYRKTPGETSKPDWGPPRRAQLVTPYRLLTFSLPCLFVPSTAVPFVGSLWTSSLSPDRLRGLWCHKIRTE